MTAAHRKTDFARIAANFDLDGVFRGAAPCGGGHIHDTHALVCDRGGRQARYILQRVNRGVFHRPDLLMDNIARVTEHVRAKVRAECPRGDPRELARRALTLVPARDGSPCWFDADGECWRVFVFVERATAYDAARSPDHAYQAALAFGRFLRRLADLPGPRLHETIRGFHDTPARFAALRAAVASDPLNRAAAARTEIGFAERRAGEANTFARLHAEGRLPERVVHNDTKLNNVLLDDATGEAVCVLDLDTVMPGLALHDFGDLVRTAAATGREDDRDPSGVGFDLTLYAAAARGYLEGTAGLLTPAETEWLAFAGGLITLEIGVRFLTDFLVGDRYFKVARPGHNLDRCRTQFRLVESIETSQDAMRKATLERR